MNHRLPSVPRCWTFILAIILLTLNTPGTVRADDPLNEQDDVRNHPWYVFLQRNIEQSGFDRLVFIDMATGQQVAMRVTGERYTPVGSEVMFFDHVQRQVMVATPDGNLRPHSFVQLTTADLRVDWVVSQDRSAIAWTITTADDQGRLVTTTRVANSDGTDARVVLVDGPYDVDIRALPLTFSADLNTLYMDYHPDATSQFIVFNQYASIFSVDLQSDTTKLLPGEPANCLCAADVERGLFVRMRLADDLNGFDVHVYNLSGQLNHTIPALILNDYDTTGDLIISPDGTRAVYALARLDNSGGGDQLSTRTVFVLVNLQSMAQSTLTNPITTFLRPIAWTEDNSAIILVSPNQDGTWKITLSDGRLERIAEASYLGILLRSNLNPPLLP